MNSSGHNQDCQLDERVWKGLEYLEAVAGPGAIAEMVDHFAQDTPDRIQRMKGLLETGDRVLLARLAHDLKSNSATLGIPAISVLGANLEQAAESGHFDGMESLIEEVERLFPCVRAELDRRRAIFESGTL